MPLLSSTPLLFLYLCIVSASSSEHSLSALEMQEILGVHNYLRSRVSPPATNMERMDWDRDLARVAQSYAQKCTFDHNPHRSEKSVFSYVGENIAITNNPNTNYTALTEGWYAERYFYDVESGQCVEKECLHYTQIAWANSARVGCGAYKCGKAIGFPYPDSTILVCNYGPGGNKVGEYPYVIGSSACSSCPQEKPLCWNNLCT